MRHRMTALAGIAALATGTALLTGLLTAPGVSAAGLRTYTVTREGHTLQLDRTATTRTAVTGNGPTRADFDGDGVDDIASGVTGPAVVVVYSSAAANDVLTLRIADTPFGATMAVGNFDGDRYDDLVVGVSSEPDSATNPLPAGGVWVVPGSASGLDLARTVHVDQDTPGVPGSSDGADSFGSSLATGDLTGDGLDDLAVGAPSEDIGTVSAAGAVTVLKGSPSGLTTTGARVLHQNLAWIPGAAESFDSFGEAVAIGRVDRGGNADLAIATTWENETSGMVTLVPGAPGGVSTTGVTAVTGTAAAKAYGDPRLSLDHFGSRLAIGDTTGDGLGEVVVGVPAAEVRTSTITFFGSGAVVVLAGRTGGLSTAGLRVLDLDSPGIPGTRKTADQLGDSLDVGDVTGDGRADVLVGVRGRRVGMAFNAGAAVLLRGAASGLTGTGSQLWTQASAGVPGTPETDDAFGTDVALLNLDGRGGLDAVVGTPFEQLSSDPPKAEAGLLMTFTGTSAGLVPRKALTRDDFTLAGLRGGLWGLELSGQQSTA